MASVEVMNDAFLREVRHLSVSVDTYMLNSSNSCDTAAVVRG